MVDALVSFSLFDAGAPDFEMKVPVRDIQSPCHGFAHQGQPVREGLLPAVFSDHKVTPIPVHHGPDFRDIPVIEPEHLKILSGIPFVQMLKSFFDAIGKHFCLDSGFILDIFVHVQGLLFQYKNYNYTILGWICKSRDFLDISLCGY
jgi:hypothetical protein